MNLRHFDNDGTARFITFCTRNRFPIFVNDILRSILADAIDRMRIRTGFRLLGYVIMPEHVHLIIVPAGDMKIGSVIGEIKRISAKRILQLIKEGYSDLAGKLTITDHGRKKFALWQPRCYDHNCRTTKSILDKLTYCHNNPVKRGLVGSPGEWRWSSHNYYSGMRNILIEIDGSVCPA